MNHWLILYANPRYLRTDRGTKIFSRFSAKACALLGVKHSTTTAYHPQTNAQAEWFDKTVLTHLRD